MKFNDKPYYAEGNEIRRRIPNGSVATRPTRILIDTETSDLRLIAISLNQAYEQGREDFRCELKAKLDGRA